MKTAEGELRRRYKEIAKEHPDWIMEKDYTEETVEVKKMTLLSNPTHVYAKEPVVFYEMTELMKQAEKLQKKEKHHFFFAKRRGSSRHDRSGRCYKRRQPSGNKRTAEYGESG